MAFEIGKWLDEVAADGSLSQEERAAALKVLAKDPKIAKKIEEGNLRQADYSRNMEALKKKENETTELIKANTTWKQDAEKKLIQATRDLETERTTRGQYEAKIQTIAAEYGLDVKDLLPAASAAPAPVTTPMKAEPDPQYVSREAFEQATGIQLRFPAVLADIGAQHQKLFGVPLEANDDMAQECLRTGTPLKTVWEQRFNVQNRRDELAREADAKREADIRADERSRVLSETSLPTSRPDQPRSPIFVNTKLSENRVNSMVGVAAAVRDFNQRGSKTA